MHTINEDRITKDTSIDILYLVAKQLRIEQVYSPSWEGSLP